MSAIPCGLWPATSSLNFLASVASFAVNKCFIGKELPLSFTRRNFLQTSALATTSLLISSEQSLAQADAQSKPLPAPITRLKSRKSEATPISAAEREQRLEKARQLMAENKLDAIMLIG